MDISVNHQSSYETSIKPVEKLPKKQRTLTAYDPNKKYSSIDDYADDVFKMEKMWQGEYGENGE